MKLESRTPLTATVVLLLLLLLYVGSYLAMVLPDGRTVMRSNFVDPETLEGDFSWSNYRFGYPLSDRIFWPLELLDRRVRPGTWGIAPNWQDKFRSSRSIDQCQPFWRV